MTPEKVMLRQLEECDDQYLTQQTASRIVGNPKIPRIAAPKSWETTIADL